MVSCLSLLEQGQSTFRRAEEQRLKSPEDALDSFNGAQDFSNALFQNKALSYDERRDIAAGLVRAYFESGDILRSLGRTEEARASYEKAQPYCSHEEIEQKLSSLSFSPQAAHEEREEIVVQLAGSLAGSTVEGSGNASNVSCNPAVVNPQLLAESQKQHSQDSAAAFSALFQLPATQGRRIAVQTTSGVANSVVSGKNNRNTMAYGSRSAPAAVSDPATSDAKRNNSKRCHSIESKMIAIKDKYGIKDKGVANPI